MPAKRALVAICVDVDCCSGWISGPNGELPDSTTLSRGIFGANIGLTRLLNVFDEEKIPGTFNIPTHTLESFPAQVQRIFDSPLGHEIGCHGYNHEDISTMTEDMERTVLQKSVEVYKKVLGKAPKGYIAPSWQTSPNTIRLLEEQGFEYDHSYFSHDCQPHWAFDLGPKHFAPANYKNNPSTWMVPMKKVSPSSKIVEIAGNWDLTDFAAFNFVPMAPNSHGYVAPAVIEQNWKDMFTFWNSENDDAFVFAPTIHPQSSGKPHVLMMVQRFLKWVKTHDNVEFVTCSQIADDFRQGRIKGATITAGV